VFNGAVPLIALKMTAYKVGDEHALTFVKVLDEIRYGLVDDDEPLAEPTDRHFWESTRGSKKTLSVTDGLMKLVNEVEPKAALKYNKHYIGLEVDGSPFNFVTFMPRRAHVIMTLKLPKKEETDNILEEAGLVTLAYETQCRQYRLRIDTDINEKKREVLIHLIRQARESFGRSA
jgi:hypothetical protein